MANRTYKKVSRESLCKVPWSVFLLSQKPGLGPQFLIVWSQYRAFNPLYVEIEIRTEVFVFTYTMNSLITAGIIWKIVNWNEFGLRSLTVWQQYLLDAAIAHQILSSNGKTHIYEKMDIVLEHLGETRSPVVLLGHFNAKHSEWFVGDSTNCHGRILKDLMDRHDMHQLVSQPTHLNNEGNPAVFLTLYSPILPISFRVQQRYWHHLPPQIISQLLSIVQSLEHLFTLLWAVKTPHGTMR